MKKSQSQWVIEQLENNAQISRNQCLRRYISRLSAIIFNLKEKGWIINGYLNKTAKGTDFIYVCSGMPKQIKKITK
jgi:hypothetical protein